MTQNSRIADSSQSRRRETIAIEQNRDLGSRGTVVRLFCGLRYSTLSASTPMLIIAGCLATIIDAEILRIQEHSSRVYGM